MRQSVFPRNIEVIDDQMAAVLRSKSTVEKIAMIGSANRTARALCAAGIQFRHPDWDEQRVQVEVARRMLNGAT